jgi:hypothetical protein
MPRGAPRRNRYGVPVRRLRAGTVSTRLVFGTASRYVLPVTHGIEPPHPYNRQPGFEEDVLPEQGPPGSEWWNQPSYRGRQ